MPSVAADATSIELQSRDFDVLLDRESQTLVSLKPKGGGGFDFAPSKLRSRRSGDGYYHLGDVDLRVRTVGDSTWHDYSTAFQRLPVTELPTEGAVLAAGAIAVVLPGDLRLQLIRRWEQDNDTLVLRVEVINQSGRAVEVGGLGFAMVFDNVLTDRTLAQAHTEASFADPYIGLGAGYLQVTRLNGQPPALVVVGDAGTPFEAYKPILDQKADDGRVKLFNDATKRSLTFEGFYTWMAASRGFAEQEWRGAQQWNEPTSFVLASGERRQFALRLLLSPSIRDIENTLKSHGRPVALGIPGYVVPIDLPADLWLSASQPVRAIDVYPRGAMEVAGAGGSNGWARYRVIGKQWGRARLTVTYADGLTQAIHYFVTKPSNAVLDDMGRFLTTRQWFDDASDPFGRAPSIMSFDRERDAIVLQDRRVWIAGLSDEGGAGSWLALIMKQLGAPNAAELEKFERFVTGTLDGRLQVNEGVEKFGVRKSLFYYDAKAKHAASYDPAIDWSQWSAWDRAHADSVVRSFNYVHAAAAYWVLYRVARYHEGLVKAHDWRWYLDRAYETARAMPRLAPEYAKFGQMEGQVFIDILRDLQDEGLKHQSATLEAAMRQRADAWAKEDYPFGSEMPWDSTGQPEVYAWMRYFGNTAKAEITRDVILGYDPTLPSWGYNGNARRYWDFLYAGKIAQQERQIHHYGSSNNALPLFDAYRRQPSDLYLLRIAYGGLMGTLTNIDQQGFGSAAFHSNPDLMKFDPYSGDYGTAFFGYAYGAGSYLARHPVFGHVGFGGEVREDATTVSIAPRDGFRRRVFLAEPGLWLTLDAGKFERIDYEPKAGVVTVHLDPADAFTPRAYLSIESTVDGAKSYQPATSHSKVRGRYVIALSKGGTALRLQSTTPP